ncbi:DUF4129 domain-containing protein [Aridibaculum aurantiacum]|uniref:DUF4129 domain-containing protein n=1 Tax=Aridibaculum aurantiacum TaxID=2810307 RepID=UPI001A972D9E|nr:DUF4129 domain-containing protein [Aridibaculum aurantiacum]
MRYFILFMLMLLSTNVCVVHAQERELPAVQVRQFDKAALEELKKNEDYQYDRLAKPSNNLWQKFWRWFWWKVDQLFETEKSRSRLWMILIVIGLIGVAFAGWKISKMNKGGFFAGGAGKGLEFTVGSEDIHQISFQEAINDAIAAKDYRLAVRLLYLQSLKIMADNSIIDWKLNKTNSDYVREVKDRPWQPLFSRLTYQFEYAWYGEAHVTAEGFEDLKQAFTQLHKLV